MHADVGDALHVVIKHERVVGEDGRVVVEQERLEFVDIGQAQQLVGLRFVGVVLDEHAHVAEAQRDERVVGHVVDVGARQLQVTRLLALQLGHHSQSLDPRLEQAARHVLELADAHRDVFSKSLTASTISYTWRCAVQKRLLTGNVRVMSDA